MDGGGPSNKSNSSVDKILVENQKVSFVENVSAINVEIRVYDTKESTDYDLCKEPEISAFNQTMFS